MRLADYFTPLLAIVRGFQKLPADDAAALALRIDTQIENSRRKALDDGRTPTDYEAALFPVVAWADEALISLDWPGAREWPRRLLQKRYFNLSTAGIEFFTRLDLLGHDETEVMEVYFLCLCLGFQGRYSYDRNPKALAERRQQLLSMLNPDPAIFPINDLLIPEGYQSDATAQERHAKSRHHWRFSSFSTSLFVVPLMVLVVLYGIYHMIINYIANSIIQRL